MQSKWQWHCSGMKHKQRDQVDKGKLLSKLLNQLITTMKLITPVCILLSNSRLLASIDDSCLKDSKFLNWRFQLQIPTNCTDGISDSNSNVSYVMLQGLWQSQGLWLGQVFRLTRVQGGYSSTVPPGYRNYLTLNFWNLDPWPGRLNWMWRAADSAGLLTKTR